MSEQTVKVKLRAGDKEIELEGPRHDVDQLLEKWWTSKIAPAGAAEERSRSRSLTTRRTAKPAGATEANAFDANAVANAIKEDENFSAIEQKILHVDRERYNKLALVLWFVDKPLTSGDIFRVLQALHVRINLPGVSMTLSRNMKSVTTTKTRSHGGAPAAYQLTSKARSEFDRWLKSSDDE